MRRIFLIALCLGAVGGVAMADDAAVMRALRAARYKDVKILARGGVVVATAADRGGAVHVVALTPAAKGKPLDLGDAVGTSRTAAIGTFLKSKDLVAITYVASTSHGNGGSSETETFLVRPGKKGLELTCAFTGSSSFAQGDERSTTTTTLTQITESPLVFEVASHTVKEGGMGGGLGPEDHVIRYTILVDGPCDEADVTPADQLPY